MSGPRAWLAQHASKQTDPNKWVFFGVAWAATIGGLAAVFQTYTMLYPVECQVTIDEDQMVHAANRTR